MISNVKVGDVYMKKHLKVINDYNLTTDNYNKIIEKFNTLKNNGKCVVLNDDCIFYILTFLGAFDVVKCSLINKQFYMVSKNEMLWEKIFNNAFYTVSKNEMFWKQNYNKKYFPVKYADTFYESYIKNFNIDIDMFKNKVSDVNVTRIELGEMFMNHLSERIGQLTKLTILHLTCNRLQVLPMSLFKLRNLTVLNLTFNRITFIPPEIEQLSNLKELHLSYNELKTIPPEVGNLEYLRDLSINNNYIEIVPKEIGKLKKLRILKLNNKLLENIPSEIRKLRYLKYYICN